MQSAPWVGVAHRSTELGVWRCLEHGTEGLKGEARPLTLTIALSLEGKAFGHETNSQYMCEHACLVTSVMSDSTTPWTVAHQAPLSMGFSRQEYWSGLPCTPPRDLPDPGIEPMPSALPALQADSLPLSHLGSPSQYVTNVYSSERVGWEPRRWCWLRGTHNFSRNL